MSRPIAEYWAALFEPVAIVAGRRDLLKRLKTADLTEERKAEQIRKLSALRLVGTPAMLSVRGGAVIRFRDGSRHYFGIMTHDFTPDDSETLDEFAGQLDSFTVEMDESTFLFLRFTMRDLYPITDSMKKESNALNALDLLPDDGIYPGHDIYETMKWFKTIAVFEVNATSPLMPRGVHYLAAQAALRLRFYRSPIIDGPLVGTIANLTELTNIDPYDVLFLLTSGHWRHAFLHLFRCLEALFYLPWGVEFRDQGKFPDSPSKLMKIVYSVFGSRITNIESIRKLFQLTDDRFGRDNIILSNINFVDIKAAGQAENWIQDRWKAKIGERIYEIRNRLVHRDNLVDREGFKVAEDGLGDLAVYLSEVVIHLYQAWSADIPYDYLEKDLSSLPDVEMADS